MSVVLVMSASTGIANLVARPLSRSGDREYAGIRDEPGTMQSSS